MFFPSACAPPQKVGVNLDQKGRVVVDPHFKTNVDGIYAIGDVIAGPMLAHKAEEDGVAVVEHLAGKGGHVNYATIPSVLYTDPEVTLSAFSSSLLFFFPFRCFLYVVVVVVVFVVVVVVCLCLRLRLLRVRVLLFCIIPLLSPFPPPHGSLPTSPPPSSAPFLCTRLHLCFQLVCFSVFFALSPLFFPLYPTRLLFLVIVPFPFLALCCVFLCYFTVFPVKVPFFLDSW